MASSGSGYDLSASTFSPDGRIFQVEYAGKAVENAGTVIGIKSSMDNGVVLGVSKPLLHKMVVPSTCSYKRIHHLDSRAGMASTGFLPDARQLVSRAIDEATDFKEQYGSDIAPRVLADRLGSYVHYFTLHGALRPFGASGVLAAAYNDNGSDKPQTALFMVEPNGAAFSYYGVACGKGKQAAKTELEKLQLHKTSTAGAADGGGGVTTDEAVRHIAKILTLLHQENKDNAGKKLEIELSWICQQSNWKHQGVPKDVIAAAMTWAQEQLDEEDDDEEEEGAAAMQE